MQLKTKKIIGLLSMATASLMSHSVQADGSQWNIDSALLIYSETDRVTAVEPVVSLSKDLGDDKIFSVKTVLDTLTGASATGAVPSAIVQTFTSPSGEKTYTSDPHQTPLDETFKDTRAALSMNLDSPIGRNNRSNIGFNVSAEHDFTSISGNASWQHFLDNKNTTLTVGTNFESDKISPQGSVPIALTDTSLSLRGSSSKTKTVVDLMFGVTQVINSHSLFQINLSLSESSGYMTDPYKMVSIVDATGEPTFNIFENRKDKRSKQSLFGKYKVAFDNSDIFTLSYRYMTDDWGVNSHTIDTTYKYKLSHGYYVQPHLRFYKQSAADFYRYFLRDNETVPEFVSADYRLGELNTNTIGLKIGRNIDDQRSWSARLEYYQQSGQSSPAVAIGQLKQQDLFPDVNAIIIQVNYSFKW